MVNAPNSVVPLLSNAVVDNLYGVTEHFYTATQTIPWFGVELQHIVENPMVVAVMTTDSYRRQVAEDTQLEVWIGNKWLANGATWSALDGVTKCGTITQKSTGTNYRVWTTQCVGTGRYLMLRPKRDTASLLALTEVRVSVDRSSSLGVRCVKVTDEKAAKVIWFVNPGDNGINDDYEAAGDSALSSFGSIQNAINVAQDGDVVQLMSGTYVDSENGKCVQNLLVDGSAEESNSADWTLSEFTTRTSGHSGQGWKSVLSPGSSSSVLRHKQPIELITGKEYILSSYTKVDSIIQCRGGFGRYINLEAGSSSVMNLAEIKVYGTDNTLLTIAAGEMSSVNSNSHVASKCFDGVDGSGFCHTGTDFGQWWAAFDLGSVQCVESIQVHNRVDSCCSARIVGAKIKLSTCSARTCSRKSWGDIFTENKAIYQFQLPVPTNIDSKPDLMYLRIEDLPARTTDAKFQGSNIQGAIHTLPTDTTWTYNSFKFTAGFKNGQPITDTPTHKISLDWHTMQGHPRTHTWGNVYLDDVSIQLADGHAGATGRHCNHNLNFMGKKITLRGESKETTVIDCGRDGTTMTNVADRGLIFVSDEGRDTVVEKLTIMNCRSATYSQSAGGYTSDLREAGAKTNVGQFGANMFGSAIVIRNSGPTIRDVNLIKHRGQYGGAITMQGGSGNGLRPLLANVKIMETSAASYGGGMVARSICFDWIGGGIISTTSVAGGSGFRILNGCGADGNILVKNLIVRDNTNTNRHYGASAFWIHYVTSTTMIRNVVFSNNEDSRVRDIILQVFNHNSVHLINNVHVPPAKGSLSYGIPPVVKVLMSCDEVADGHRGLINGDNVPKTYWLQHPLDGNQIVETRCSFIPKGGLTNLHLARTDPLNLEVEGWNVIARRQWQDGNGFDKTWNEYKNGFGDLNTAFWTGNDQVSKWTQNKEHALRVDFCTVADNFGNAKIEIEVEQDFSKWSIESGASRQVHSDGSVTYTRDVNNFRDNGKKSGIYCETDWHALGSDETLREATCAANGGNCFPKAALNDCQTSCGKACYGVSYESSNQWCLLITLSKNKDACTTAKTGWSTYFVDGNRDFVWTVDLSASFNRFPTTKMQLTIDGEASIQDNALFRAWWYSGDGSESLASKYLPTEQGSTTVIDIQPPLGYDKAPTQLKLRLNFEATKWGESFTLRKVQLYAINECGEGLYDTFAVDTEANKYAATRTSSLDWKVSSDFLNNAAYRNLAVSGFIQEQKFSTKDRDNDMNAATHCSYLYLGGWWYASCHAGILTGTYPHPNQQSLPEYARGVSVYSITGFYSSLQSLEMKIKPNTPFSALPGPTTVVSTCSNLISDIDIDTTNGNNGCSHHCIDRPMLDGGQHPLGVLCLAQYEFSDRTCSNLDSTIKTWELCQTANAKYAKVQPVKSSFSDDNWPYGCFEIVGQGLYFNGKVDSQDLVQDHRTVRSICKANVSPFGDKVASGNNVIWWVASGNGDDHGGQGSHEYPFATISMGISVARRGDIVQLSSGIFSGGNDDGSCNWCTEIPIWTGRCNMYTEIPDVKSSAECLIKCRSDPTCEYSAYGVHSSAGKLCRHTSERACTLAGRNQESIFSTHYCPKTRTKRCNYNIVVNKNNITVAGAELDSHKVPTTILDCAWSRSAATVSQQQRRGFIISAGVKSFTLRRVTIRRCRAGCGPPFYIPGTTFDTAFVSLDESMAPSRILCSGGGLAAKASATVSLDSVRFEQNIGREGGGVILVQGARGSFIDVYFEGNTADAGGALLVTSGAQLDWYGGGATENCGRLVEAAAIEISDDNTRATLVGVTVENSRCDITSTCPKRREHAYRSYLCRSNEQLLYDFQNVWQDGAVCTAPTTNHFIDSSEYKNGWANKFPQPSWSDYAQDVDMENIMPDCVGQADVPHGIRVTGSTPNRNLIDNGEFENGLPLLLEQGSWNGYGDLDDAKVQYQFPNKISDHSCRRNSVTCLGRSIVPIDDGPSGTSISHALQFRRPSNLVEHTLLGEYEVHISADKYMQLRGTITVGAWYRCSVGFTKEFPNWGVIHRIRVRHSTGKAEKSASLRSNLGAPGESRCDDTWRHIEHAFDYEKGPAAQAISIHIGYPLQMTTGTFQITGITAEVTPSTIPHDPPTLICLGCMLLNNAHHDIKSTDKVLVNMIDSSTLHDVALALAPIVGEGGYLVRGGAKKGDRVWTPGIVNNIVNNGNLVLGEHMDHFAFGGITESFAKFGSLHKLTKKNVACKSGDVQIGTYSAVGVCHRKCVATTGCKYFLFGKDTMAGRCIHEFTTSSCSEEGWESDAYDFYEVISTGRIRSLADWQSEGWTFRSDAEYGPSVDPAAYGIDAENDRGCGGEFMCWYSSGQPKGELFKTLPSYHGMVTVRWGSAQSTCELFIAGKLIDTASQGTQKTTTTTFRPNDILLMKESSICTISWIDVSKPGIACADGSTCQEMIESDGYQIATVLDGPEVYDYSGYALRFSPRSNPAADRSSYSITIQLGGNNKVAQRPIPPRSTWGSASALCRYGTSLGRLCTKSEMCVSDTPHGGTLADQDVWVPVNDAQNTWVQAGDKHHTPCKTHDPPPAWGTQPTSQSYKRIVFCCSDDPAPVDPVAKAWNKYHLCAWVRISTNFDGSDAVLLPSRWYAENGTMIHDTLSPRTNVGRVRNSVAKDGQWHRYCEDINIVTSDGTTPSWFNVFVGRRLGSEAGTPHTKGTVEITMLSVKVRDDFNSQGWHDFYDEAASNSYRWVSAPKGLLNNSRVSYLAFSRQGMPTRFEVGEKTLATVCCWKNSGTPTSSDGSSSSWSLIEGTYSVTGNELLCYQAKLQSGTHEITGKCLKTGVFLQRPLDMLGGSCNDNACPADATACRTNPKGGVLCYGCTLKYKVDKSTTYSCDKNGIQVSLVHGRPPPYVHPNITILEFVSSDFKCKNITVHLDDALVVNIVGAQMHSLEHGARVRVYLPTLSFGPHVVTAQVSCTQIVKNSIQIIATSPILTTKWTVVDPRSTNTSILGIETTSSSDITFDLTANKLGCSYKYQLDTNLMQTIVGAGAGVSIATRIVTTAQWSRTALNVIYQSSRGAGVVFRSTLQKISTSSSGDEEVGPLLQLPAVTAHDVSRQAQLTLSNLVLGSEYELSVDVQNGQAKMIKRIIVGGNEKYGNGGVWKTYLWTETNPVTTSVNAMFEFGCSSTSAVKYIYSLDKGAAVPTKKNLIVLEGLNTGDHTMTVYCEHEDGSAGDLLPLSFVWEVVGGTTSVKNPYYEHYVRKGAPTTSMTVSCPRPTINIPPNPSASQKHALVLLGSDKDDTETIPAHCGWRVELDGTTFTTTTSSLTVIGPLQVGHHVLRVFSSSNDQDQPHSPSVVSWTVESELPWDQTSVTFKGVAPGWHVLKAHATDPMNITDVLGVVHRFFIDQEPPVSVLISDDEGNKLFGSDDSGYTKNRQHHYKWSCTDNNPFRAMCDKIEWALLQPKGGDALENDVLWKVASSSLLGATLIDLGVDGRKRILVRSTDFAGNVEIAPFGVDTAFVLDTTAPEIEIQPSFDTHATTFLHAPVLFSQDTNLLEFQIHIEDLSPITNISCSIRFGTAALSKENAMESALTLTCPAPEKFATTAAAAAAIAPMYLKNNATNSTSLPDGSYRIEISASDTVGQINTTNYVFVADGTPPVTLIIMNPDVRRVGTQSNIDSSSSNSITADTTMTLSVTAKDALVSVVSVICTLDNGEEINDCNNEHQQLSDLTDGLHVFKAWSLDEVGNSHADTPTAVQWTVDLTPPTLQVDPLSTVDNILSIGISATCLDAWSTCFVEWDLQTNAEIENKEQGCGPTYKWSLINGTGGGQIDAPVLAFGSYVVSVRARDAVGNHAEIFAQTATVKTKTTIPPRSLQRYVASPTNLTLTWEDPEFQDIPGISYIVQFSTAATFPEDPRTVQKATEQRSLGTSITLSLPMLLVSEEDESSRGTDADSERTLYNTLIIARVRRAGALEWSLPTDSWTISSECVDVQYLNTLSNKMEPSNWTCLPCPRGGYCVGDVIWTGVQGKFGYWRVPGPAPQTFEPCIFAGACLGAPNLDLANQFFMNGTDLAGLDANMNETCNEQWGHNNDCGKDGRCRLCNSCRPNFKPGSSRGRCDSCPSERSTNVLFMVLGVLVAIGGAAGIVALTIIAGGGVVEVSEATKKILINYLQVVSLAAVFPVRWPAHVESFFAFQSAISSVSKTLLSPDCELSFMTPAEAFYQKQVGFAFLPIVIVVVCNLVWFLARIYSQQRSPLTAIAPPAAAAAAAPPAAAPPAATRPAATSNRTEHYADRAVLSWVTLLYLAYPTSVTQGLAMMGCEEIGGKLWLAADLQEACYEGRHMELLFLLCFPQVILFVIGMPLGALAVLWRHRKDLHNPRTQFRWGILYAGYRDELYFWEITIIIRKLVMVMVGGVFASRLGPDMQVYMSLALVVIFMVCHLVAQPFNELTIHHNLLHWLELGALLACFATLYSGMLFYLGHETDRIPSWSLDLASVVIIGGNCSFMIYTIVIFIIAMRREAKESEGLTAAERRLHLLKISKRKSNQKGKGKGKNHTNDSNKKSSGNNKGVRRRSLQSMKNLANLAVHHDKGVRNIEQHTITKNLQQNKLKRRQSNSKARLNARLHAMKVAAEAANSTHFFSIKKQTVVEGDNVNGTAAALAEVKIRKEISLQKVAPKQAMVPRREKGGEQQRQMMIGASNTAVVQKHVLGRVQQQQQQQQQPQQQQLSTYNKLRIEIGRKLASVESTVLFAKLDIDGSNSLSRKEFMRLLAAVSKPNTNKETIRKAWREAIKGNVGKAELNINDLLEYVHSCGEYQQGQAQLHIKK
jgi:hypothetical protein